MVVTYTHKTPRDDCPIRKVMHYVLYLFSPLSYQRSQVLDQPSNLVVLAPEIEPKGLQVKSVLYKAHGVDCAGVTLNLLG